MKRALRRAATSRRLLLLSALLLIVAPVGGTWAFFSADTVSSTSQFTGGWVGEASGGAVGPSGYDAILSWTKATHVDTVTGQTVTYADQGPTSNCTGANYTNSVGAVGTGTSFTTNGFTSALNGHYVCFQLATADNNWTSAGYVFPVAHLGLFPITTTITNGGTAGQADANDTITITFNQNLSTASLPPNTTNAATQISVCFISSTVLIGDTSGCSNVNTDSYTVAKITNMSFTGTFNANQSSITTSGATVTVVLGTSGHGSNSHSNAITNVTSGLTFAQTTVLSAVTSDQASACNVTVNGCTPAPSAGSTF